jgi:hypothetical protein
MRLFNRKDICRSSAKALESASNFASGRFLRIDIANFGWKNYLNTSPWDPWATGLRAMPAEVATAIAKCRWHFLDVTKSVRRA